MLKSVKSKQKALTVWNNSSVNEQVRRVTVSLKVLKMKMKVMSLETQLILQQITARF